MTAAHSLQSRIGRLRAAYMDYLSSPLSDGRRGNVAGKGTCRGMRQAAKWQQQAVEPWLAMHDAWLATPERVWVWSDHHLGHENVIRYTGRPFGTSREADQAMLDAASIVPPDDWLLFLGDVAMWHDPLAVQAWVSSCPGRKLLVLGNHDARGHADLPKRLEDWQRLGFESVSDCMILPCANDRVLWLTHYPLLGGLVPQGVLNIHGHTHQKKMEGRLVNVCVEQLDYRPRKLAEVAA